MASGDNCMFGRDTAGRPNGTAIHWDCDDYPDGTITDINTGTVIGRKQVNR